VSSGNTSYSNRVTNNDVGLNEIYDNTIISVFPNPNNGNFSIQIKSLNEIKKIEVFNVLGKRIYLKENNFDLLNPISLIKGLDGVYSIKISIQDHVFTNKIVVVSE
ncbi:MAG: T9SS type A sorting domain-containing protein, partial [Flavobacteriales bacterium]|nr:T9SS type A sorting domain-containing protein [Flavobacteriales bacterium]